MLSFIMSVKFHSSVGNALSSCPQRCNQKVKNYRYVFHELFSYCIHSFIHFTGLVRLVLTVEGNKVYLL